MSVSVRLMWERRAGLASSPSKEVEWVRAQLDRPVELPAREQLEATKWLRQQDRSRRAREARQQAVVQEVDHLPKAPVTYAHVDLPTGKRLYLPLKPGQEAAELRAITLEGMNQAGLGRKGVKDAAAAADAARQRKAAAGTLQAALRLKRQGRRRHARQAARVSGLQLAVASDREETDLVCALPHDFRDGKPSAAVNRGAPSRRAAAEQALTEAFHRVDKDGDGAINRRELILGLRRSPDIAALLVLPGKVRQEDGSRDAVEAFFQTIDADSDNELTLQELLAHFGHRATAGPPAAAVVPPMALADHPADVVADDIVRRLLGEAVALSADRAGRGEAASPERAVVEEMLASGVISNEEYAELSANWMASA
jgi:hypothetical protein